MKQTLLKTGFTTRLAPSPTGELHLGNARTFLINYALARQNGWRVVLRLEDLDPVRTRPDAIQRCIDDLNWLGLLCDGPALLQSSQRPQHELAIDQLIQAGLAYPCVCKRKELETAASAPHADDGAMVYPGTCRGRVDIPRQTASAIRFKLDDDTFEVVDGFAGLRQWNPRTQLGDFPIAVEGGAPAYQLAVVVDDIHQGVTHVVRGDDLLDSIPRQAVLYRALAHPVPRYFHLPLVAGPDGRRLAKRHAAELPQDTRLSRLRAAGVAAQRVIALIGQLSGLEPRYAMTLDQFIDEFDLARLPRSRVAVTTEMMRTLS